MWIVKRVALFLVFQSICATPRKLPCPTSWIPTSYGEIPSGAEPVRPSILATDQLIARLVKEAKVIGGRAEALTGTGYFPSATNDILVENNYEILTNPNACLLQWTRDESSEFRVRVFDGSNAYIGRATTDGGRILSGQTFGGSHELTVAESGVLLTSHDEFEYLESYSDGLRLEMTGFAFEENGDIVADIELAGIDEIHNRANVEARQVVSHRSRFMESYTFSSSSAWGLTISVGLKVDLEIPIPLANTGLELSINVGLDLGFSFSEGNEESKEIHTETEKELNIGREIVIPPYTSLQACSTSTTIKDFELKYTSTDKYWAPGLSSADVSELLREDGITGGEEVGEAVYVPRSGNFKGALAVMTQFLVMPIAEDGVGGCSELDSKLKELKRRKSQTVQDKGGMDELEQEIFAIVHPRH